MNPGAPALLAWCLGLGAVIHYFLSGPLQPVPPGFSAVFWYLLKAFDPLGNGLLMVIALVAFALRARSQGADLVLRAGSHPWVLGAALFACLCAGAVIAYRGAPLSMDEYSAVFQAKAFAAGSLAGRFPPELLDHLIPRGFHGLFLTVSRATGEVASTYWPGFALLLAPFERLGIPWALNPALAALSLPVVHRLALRASGSAEAAAWAVLLLVASPAFTIAAISYYSMTAHLLLNALFAVLLLHPTPGRGFAAGLLGGVALALHNPLPHVLFAAAFFAWLLWRRTPLRVLVAMGAGYALPVAVLVLGWKLYLQALAVSAPAPAAASAAAAAPLAPGPWKLFADQFAIFTLPTARILDSRFAGLTKVWTWGAAGMLVLAAWGLGRAEAGKGVRALAAAALLTFLGYFAIRFDQGHGWGYRYMHSALFVFPVLAGVALAGPSTGAQPARRLAAMAGWGVLLALLLANGLRLEQAAGFVRQQWTQVPPLARAAAGNEVVFVDPRAGFYSVDRVQNDPFLRARRIIMVGGDAAANAAVMARHFPGYARREGGPWGERWTKEDR